MTKRTYTPKMRYLGQKHSAKNRGIEFLFSFEEWVKWWETNLGAAWMTLRGCRIGQYVMARNGDVGPYAAWNVKCLLTGDNGRQRALNRSAAAGAKHGMSRLTTKQVQAIYVADKACYWELARRYKVSHVAIRFIRHRQTWQHDTFDLQRGKDCDCYHNGHKCRRGLSRAMSKA